MQKQSQIRSLFSWFKKTDLKTSNYSFNILGFDTQLLELNLLPYQSVRIDPSSLIYHEPGITMDTKMMTSSSSGIQRAISGSSLFVIDLTNENEKNAALVGLTPNHYSQILHFNIEDFKSPLCFVCDSFLCSGLGVDIESKYFGLKMALVCKNLFMQKFTGKGSVFIKAGINVKDILLKTDDCLIVSSNSLLGFEDTVGLSLSANLHPQQVSTRYNFYMLRIKGPGKVFIQNTSKEGFELSLASTLTKGGLGLSQIVDFGIFGHQEQPEGTKILKTSQNNEEDYDLNSNHPDQHEQDKHHSEEQIADNSFDNSDNTIDDTIDSNFYLGGPNS